MNLFQLSLQQALFCQFNSPMDRTDNDYVTPNQLKGKKKTKATIDSWTPDILAFIQKNPGCYQEQVLKGLQKSRGKTLRMVLDKLIEERRIIEKKRNVGNLRMKVYFPL